jgi:hypothetical protein
MAGRDRRPPSFKPILRSRSGRAADEEQPRLTRDKARFLAPHWAKRLDSGEIVLSSDPAHKMVHPVLYRLEEAVACWRKTSAPVLWVWGDSDWMRKWFNTGEEDLAERRAAYQNLTKAPHGLRAHDASRPARAAG